MVNDLRSYGLDVETELLARMSEELCKQIDRYILNDLLEVTLPKWWLQWGGNSWASESETQSKAIEEHWNPDINFWYKKWSYNGNLPA